TFCRAYGVTLATGKRWIRVSLTATVISSTSTKAKSTSAKNSPTTKDRHNEQRMVCTSRVVRNGHRQVSRFLREAVRIHPKLALRGRRNRVGGSGGAAGLRTHSDGAMARQGGQRPDVHLARYGRLECPAR